MHKVLHSHVGGAGHWEKGDCANVGELFEHFSGGAHIGHTAKKGCWFLAKGWRNEDKWLHCVGSQGESHLLAKIFVCLLCWPCTTLYTASIISPVPVHSYLFLPVKVFFFLNSLFVKLLYTVSHVAKERNNWGNLKILAFGKLQSCLSSLLCQKCRFWDLGDPKLKSKE